MDRRVFRGSAARTPLWTGKDHRAAFTGLTMQAKLTQAVPMGPPDPSSSWTSLPWAQAPCTPSVVTMS